MINENLWMNKKICDIAEKIVAGATPSTKFPEYWDGDVCWMSSGEINKRLINETDRKITKLGYEKSSTKLIPKNSVLMALAGQGKTRGMVAINNIELCTNQSVAAIIPKSEEINFKYLYYNLYNRYEEIRMMSTSSDGGRGGLNLKIISNISIMLPPLKEQETISEILSSWDLAIDKQQQLIEKKKEFKKGLMQRLLSGEVRFKEFNDEWSETKLEEVSEITKGTQFNKSNMDDKGRFPVINGGIVPSGYSDKWNREAETITISEGGNSCGFVNYIREKFWSGGHCYTIEPLNNKIDKLFLYYALKSKENYIMNLRVGSGLPNIQKASLSCLQIRIPDIEEQKKIAEVLSTADKEIELLEKELEALKLQKKGLMQRLLTGEVRVNVE